MKIDIRMFTILRRTFVRQLSDDDCGQACVAMLLRYAGKNDEVEGLLNNYHGGNLSLLDLHNIIVASGLTAQCVTMTMDFLLQIQEPCILHTEDAWGQLHYQVCYGTVRSSNGVRFLMADPSKQFYYIDKDDLDNIWQSKAALYVVNLEADLSGFRQSSLSVIIASVGMPHLIWIIMPLLTLVNALFGVALSFLLQRGFIYTDIFDSLHIIFALLVLLLVISVFKSTFSYLRQLILLKINRKIRRRFFVMLTQKVGGLDAKNSFGLSDWAKRSYHEISLMQNGLSQLLSTLISEGSLLFILLGAVVYAYPVAGFFLLAYILSQALFAVFCSPNLLYGLSVIRQKSAHVEKSVTAALFLKGDNLRNTLVKEIEHLAVAERQALQLSRYGLLQEILGAVTVVIIFGTTAYQVYELRMSYPSLMLVVILSYIVASMMPRLCNAYQAFAEGADAFIQFKLRTSH